MTGTDALVAGSIPELYERLLVPRFPKDPPRFLSRTPFRYNDPKVLARDPALLGRATDLAEAAIAEQFGTGAVDGKIQAVIVRVER